MKFIKEFWLGAKSSGYDIGYVMTSASTWIGFAILIIFAAVVIYETGRVIGRESWRDDLLTSCMADGFKLYECKIKLAGVR